MHISLGKSKSIASDLDYASGRARMHQAEKIKSFSVGINKFVKSERNNERTKHPPRLHCPNVIQHLDILGLFDIKVIMQKENVIVQSRTRLMQFMDNISAIMDSVFFSRKISFNEIKEKEPECEKKTLHTLCISHIIQFMFTFLTHNQHTHQSVKI